MCSLVASSARAFAPFSQYSAIFEGFSGTGQAQLGQRKPSSWFISNKLRMERTIPISLNPWRRASFTPRSPAEVSMGSLRRSPVNLMSPVREMLRFVSFSIMVSVAILDWDNCPTGLPPDSQGK